MVECTDYSVLCRKVERNSRKTKEISAVSRPTLVRSENQKLEKKRPQINYAKNLHAWDHKTCIIYKTAEAANTLDNELNYSYMKVDADTWGRGVFGCIWHEEGKKLLRVMG